MIKRWIRFFAALLPLACLAAPACAADEPLRIALSRTPLSLPIMAAQRKGYFEQEGVKVEVIEHLSGVRCMQAMLDDKADLATATELPVMFNAFARDDYAVLSTIATSRGDLKLIARASAGVDSPEKLNGKRIGITVASAAHYYMDLTLLAGGVDPAGVTVVPLQAEEMQPLLTTGKVDAVVAWEPFADKILVALKADAVVIPNLGAYNETFNLIAAKRLFGKRDDDLRRVLKALDRAMEYIRREPAEAQALLRQRLHVEADFTQRVWSNFAYRLSLEQSLLATLDAEARWAISSRHVTATKAPNFLGYIHDGPLKSLRPNAVSAAR